RMATVSAGESRCESGAKSTTSAKRMEGASEGSANVGAAACRRGGVERGGGRVALVGEDREEREGARAGADDVQRQHRAREPNRKVRVREEHLAREAEEQEDEDVRDEPTHGRAHLEEDEGPERGEDAPEPDRPGGKEPADHHHPGGRREQDVEELRDEEGGEGRVAGEAHKGAERDGEVDERDDACRRAEAEVEAAPYDGDGQDQDGDHDEQRLLLAELIVVPGTRADPSEPRGRPADPADPRSGRLPRRGGGRGE